MNRVSCIFLLSSAFFFALVSGVLGAPTPLSFVASDNELNVALATGERGVIGSVAISQNFYQGSAKRTKDRIRGLMARTFELGDRMVYMYGQPLDVNLTVELLEVKPACFGPPRFLGKLVRSKDHKIVQVCDSGGVLSEEELRKQLIDYDSKLLREEVR